MMRKSNTNESLIKEQNKSLFIICVVIVVLIGIVGLAIDTSSSVKKSSNDTNYSISSDGIVNDMDSIKKNNTH